MRKQISRTHSFVDKGGRLSKWAGSMLDKLNDVADLTLSPSVATLAPTAAAVLARATAYATISLKDASSAEATTDGTPRKVAAFTTNGPSKNMQANGDDLVTVTGGTYLAVFLGAFSGTNSKLYRMAVYVNTTDSDFHAERTLSSSGASGAVAIMATIALVPGDVVSVYQWSTDGGSAMTVTQGSLVAMRISD